MAAPGIFHHNRHRLVFILNGRPIEATTLSQAVRQALGRNLPADRHAIAFLNLQVPHEEIDVNVHPAKREVRFHQARKIHDALSRAISEAIDFGVGTAFGSQGKKRILGLDKNSKKFAFTPDSGTNKISVPQQNSENNHERDLAQKLRIDTSLPNFVDPSTISSDSTATIDSVPPNSTLPPHRIIGTIGKNQLYLLLETEEGLALLHRQAAIERIFYEMLTQENSQLVVQPLLQPKLIQLDAADFAMLEKVTPELKALGFQVEKFGHNHLKIDAVPMPFHRATEDRAFENLYKELPTNQSMENINTKVSLMPQNQEHTVLPSVQFLNPHS